jgi:hypothetical protein
LWDPVRVSEKQQALRFPTQRQLKAGLHGLWGEQRRTYPHPTETFGVRGQEQLAAGQGYALDAHQVFSLLPAGVRIIVAMGWIQAGKDC